MTFVILALVGIASLLGWNRLQRDAPIPAATPAPGSAISGAIVAPVDGQVGSLGLDGSAPTVVTSFKSPIRVTDVTATLTSSLAVASTYMPPPGGIGSYSGELVTVDLASGATSTLVARRDAQDALGAPVWAADGSFLLFQADDRSQPAVAYPRQAVARFPSRVERVRADGSAREALIENARLPAPSPRVDGGIAFVRTDSVGTRLLVRDASGVERLLVDAGVFADVGYPRFSPTGDQIAFVGASDRPAPPGRTENNNLFGLALAPETAYAHGLPWDLWLIGVDGSGLRRLAMVGADDASLAWSPDGLRIFVYGDSGSFLVLTANGAVTSLPRIVGDGAISWID